MKKFAIIVAGGSGSRMGGNIAKQFLPLGDKPLLMHTLYAFYLYNNALELILVLPGKQISHWKNLCDQYGFNIPHKLVAGGATRFHSVKNGLDQILEDGLVAVHDGVRPLVPEHVIAETYADAEQYGSAVAATQLKESIRQINSQNSTALDRSRFRLVQTPQTFYVNDLKSAYSVKHTPDLTDDASIAEKAGIKIHITPGSYENIKITTPEDLLQAEAILNNRIKKR